MRCKKVPFLLFKPYQKEWFSKILDMDDLLWLYENTCRMKTTQIDTIITPYTDVVHKMVEEPGLYIQSNNEVARFVHQLQQAWSRQLASLDQKVL